MSNILPVRWFPLVTALTVLHSIGYEASGAVAAAGRERFFVGTYTGPSSLGIYHSTLPLGTGVAAPLGLASQTANPSFLALHPNHRFLYSIYEGAAGAVLAFAVNPANGDLTYLNQQPTGGSTPAHVVVDNAGKNVLVANYEGGSVTVMPVGADGRLGAATAFIQHTGSSIDPIRQEGPHPHCITLDVSNRFALVCDLGLDKIVCYRFDSALGTLTTNSTPWTSVAPGSGPRHLALAPDGQHAYLVNELNSTICAYAYDAQQGTLSLLQTISSLPSGYVGPNYPAEITVHPSGKFLYVSNRGYNSVGVFGIDSMTGLLTPVQQQPTGAYPRHFALDPTGAYCIVASQNSGTVALYRVDAPSGVLTPTGQALAVASPVCVLPYLIEAPQPVLVARALGSDTLQFNIDNSLSWLTYQLYQAPALTAPAWTLLTAGTPGQTNFTVTNLLSQGFIRAAVATNY